MSVYNAERFVAQAVDSVLNQTFSDFEFLIFEDKASDSSPEILRSYSDPRIRLVENTENLGLTKNLAAGMTMARGEFIARMDADDICMPDRLEIQLAYLDAHPDVSVLGSAVTFFDESGKEFVAHQPLEHDEIKCTLLYGFTMLHPSVMMRKGDFEKHGLNYDPAFRVSQDHDLWTRAARILRFANLPEPLLKMRNHSGNIGSTRKAEQRQLSDIVRARMIEEFGTSVSNEELTAFNFFANEVPLNSRSQLHLYSKLLLKLFETNRTIHLYEPEVFERTGAARLRAQCRMLLINANPIGRYYWRSPLRKHDRLTARELVGMVVRSLVLPEKQNLLALRQSNKKRENGHS